MQRLCHMFSLVSRDIYLSHGGCGKVREQGSGPRMCREGTHPHCTSANGFSMRMPAMICRAFRSSERMRTDPDLTAEATISASQKPMRDSSSIRNAAAISAGVVSVHHIE